MIELRPQFRNAIVGLCACLALGCHTTRNVKLVDNPDATTRPSQIEVLTRSGSRITIFQPVVRQDSVRGYSDEEQSTPVTVATSDILEARTRQFSGGRTALLTIGVVGVALLAAWVTLIAIIFSDDSY